MFQEYKVLSAPENGPPRVAALRARMAEMGLGAFLVPRADAHQGEYVAPRDARLAWLTGFTGSAGIAAITAEDAFLFVDGRYTLQARAQVAGDAFTLKNIPDDKLSEVLIEALGEGQVIGYDPWLHTAKRS